MRRVEIIPDAKDCCSTAPYPSMIRRQRLGDALADTARQDGKVFDFIIRTTPTGGTDYANINAMLKVSGPTPS